MNDVKEWLKHAIDKLDSKVDRLDQRLDNIDITLTRQASDLEDHIRRTELAEENIALLRKKLVPFEKKIQMFNGVLGLIGFIGLIIGMIEGIITTIEYFKR